MKTRRKPVSHNAYFSIMQIIIVYQHSQMPANSLNGREDLCHRVSCINSRDHAPDVPTPDAYAGFPELEGEGDFGERAVLAADRDKCVSCAGNDDIPAYAETSCYSNVNISVSPESIVLGEYADCLSPLADLAPFEADSITPFNPPEMRIAPPSAMSLPASSASFMSAFTSFFPPMTAITGLFFMTATSPLFCVAGLTVHFLDFPDAVSYILHKTPFRKSILPDGG